LDPTKVYQSLCEAIRHAVNDVRAETANISVKIIHSATMISLWFQLAQDSFYKVNFFPSIRVNGNCEKFGNLVSRYSRLRKSLFDECHFDEGIHVVAQAKKSSEDENKFWSTTFNDIEKRVVLSENFECAKDCLVYIDEKFKSLEGKRLSRYQIQAVILREIFARPNSKDWRRKFLQRRLQGVQESLNDCLRMGRCQNVFTGVNLFSGKNQDTLDEIAESVSLLDL
jgi:hypothetical protein